MADELLKLNIYYLYGLVIELFYLVSTLYRFGEQNLLS